MKSIKPQMGWFCIVVELHHEGYAINGAALSSFFYKQHGDFMSVNTVCNSMAAVLSVYGNQDFFGGTCSHLWLAVKLSVQAFIWLSGTFCGIFSLHLCFAVSRY